MYTKNRIENFFDDIKNETSLDTTKGLSWGYFFSDVEKTNLENAEKMLNSNGYNYTEIVVEGNKYHLQIEKIENHSIDTLYKRCQELDSIANSLNIDSFDGFDVEEICS